MTVPADPIERAAERIGSGHPVELLTPPSRKSRRRRLKHPGHPNQQVHAGDGLPSVRNLALADILDDTSFESQVDGQEVYVGIREDGLMDLGIGTGKDDPVARFSYGDVQAISDEAYRLWRMRGDEPSDEDTGLIDDTIVNTEGHRIYLAISNKQTYAADENDPTDEDVIEPVLTVGIPTANDSDDKPDFHEVDLDEDGFSELFRNLEAFRDDYEPESIGIWDGTGSHDVQLMADHTVQLFDGSDDPPSLSMFDASSLAEAIEDLLKVELPADGTFDPEEPDTVDGVDISDDVGVSLNEDGSLTLNLFGAGEYIRVERGEAPQLAESLRDAATTDRERGGAGITASGKRATGFGHHKHGGAPVTTKQLGRVEIKDADLGKVEAVFATFGVVDSDDDVTDPAAFDIGAEMPISAYNHGSWTGALPVGKGRIRISGTEAVLEGQFFMDTTHGRDAFYTVKNLGPLGQWSYGYDVVKCSYGEHGGRPVRFLEKLKVHEVSPVLIGAGVGTRTVAAKTGRPQPRTFHGEAEAVLAAVTALADRAADVMAKRQEKGKGLGVISAGLLGQVEAELKRLTELLTAPAEPDLDELQREYLRFVSLTRNAT